MTPSYKRNKTLFFLYFVIRSSYLWLVLGFSNPSDGADFGGA